MILAVKVFKVGDCDWIAATSAAEALAYFAEGLDDDEVDEADVHELSDEEMDKFKHLGEDGCREKWPKEQIPTFRQELADNLSEGCKAPFHFATTEI